MTIGDAPELLAACSTTAGNVRPYRTAEESPVLIERRVRAAAAAGYVGFGLRHEDPMVARDRIGLSRLRGLFAEHGMRYIQLEFLDHWWTTGSRRGASDRIREDLLKVCSRIAEVVLAESVFAVKLHDGRAAAADSRFDDTFDNRLLCGEGDFDVVGFIEAIDGIGYEGPWGVEMMSDHHRSLEPELTSLEALRAAMGCLRAAGIPGA